MKIKKIILPYMAGVASSVLVILLTLTLTGYNVVTSDRYHEIQDLEDKYGKADLLMTELLDNYYKELSEDVLLDGMYKGLFEAVGDKYTKYMDKEDFAAYQNTAKGEYVGIGIQSDLSEGNVEVIKVFKDSPADKNGIQVGDMIVEVDGQHIDDVGNSALIDVMLGEEDTLVDLKLLRDGEILSFSFERGKVHMPFVTSDVIGDIGYIYIHRFGNDAYKEFKDHLKALEKKGIEGLIIDLRNNPGGLVSQSTKITDLLLDKGLIVYTKDRAGKTREYKSDASKIEMPFVLLINNKSASASEILSGAVKATGAGSIVGVQSFGKGIVQSVNSLKDDTGYKITYSEYFTPDDKNIHGIGIEPDYVVVYEGIINEDKPNILEDLQLMKAIELLENN